MSHSKVIDEIFDKMIDEMFPETNPLYGKFVNGRFDKVSVVDEGDNIIATTDFTDKQKNLEVWKALGLQEEDFYK